ncbi:MAG: outer membrane beta-barrel protein [Paludibacteraceae bacterium]|nr:outer membrane beta-barrel protein [Paludibacteraceae bacterium]
MKKVFMTIFAAAMAMSMSAVTPHFGIEAGYDHGSGRVSTDIPHMGEYKEEVKKELKMDGFHVGGNVQLDFLDGKHIPSLVIGLNYQFLRNDLFQTDKDMKDLKKEAIEQFKEMQKEDSKYSDFNLREDIIMHTIQMPIRAQYAYQINDAFRVFAYTGPQLRFHVALQMNSEESMKYDGKKNGEAGMRDMISGREKEIGWVEGKQTSVEMIPNWSKGTAKIIYIEDGEKETEEMDIDKEGKGDLIQWFDMSWGFGVGFAWNNLSLNISYDLGMMNLLPKNEQKAMKDLNQKLIVNSDALAVTLGYRF